MPSDIQSILDQVKSYLPEVDMKRIEEAYQFAKVAHEGQLRFSGEPYITHPIAATENLLTLNPDEDTIIACLLHDVVEDTEKDIEEIKKKFGKVVGSLCADMEKLGTVRFRGQERQVENLRKMFVAMARDLRVIFIKLSDRIHNMETLDAVRPDKQKRIAKETLEVYAPIAARLGIYEFKSCLEDLAFRYLEPVNYTKVKRAVKSGGGNRKRIIERANRELTKIMQESKIKAEVAGRTKHLYSIWRKMKKKGFVHVDEIYDLFALRIFVETEADCYAVLGVIHRRYTPLSHRFKDFIAVPKVNGYQSLHTTVMGLNPDGLPTEVQIRTHAMHTEAERGAAAHWSYAENKRSVKVDEKRLNWVKSLVDLHTRLKDNQEFVETLAVDAFSDRIFVLTPAGMVLDLPAGATAVDFAYAVHTEVGHTTSGTKVNGKIRSLDQPLKNGDVVEILRKKGGIPNRFWLSFVKSESTKSKIKSYFNALDHEENVIAGKELLNKHLTRLNKSKLDSDYSILKIYKKQKLSLREREGILERIGNGSVSATAIIRDIFPFEEIAQTPQAKKLSPGKTKTREKAGKILIAGESDLPYTLAKCCKPKEGDFIAALMTPRRGANIHKVNCKMLARSNPERQLPASWGGETELAHRIKIGISGKGRVGLLRDIASTISAIKINITDINFKIREKRAVEYEVELEIKNLNELTNALDRLESAEGVEKVTQLKSS